MGIGAPLPHKRWRGGIKAAAWHCGETGPRPGREQPRGKQDRGGLPHHAPQPLPPASLCAAKLRTMGLPTQRAPPGTA
eukprot:1083910-Pyramimonas_sp.AAC.1